MAGRLFLDIVDPWINWDWVFSHIPLITTSLLAHLELTVITVVVALAISLPVGIVVQRRAFLRGPVLTLFGIFYTIPSLALFALLIPYTGLSTLTGEIGLVAYALLIVTRNVVVGLDVVPRDVLDAADGMGYRPFARLMRVDLPLALPSIFAGVRIATGSTIALITITAVIGQDSLGQLILTGLTDSFHTPLVIGTLLSVLLAVVADTSLAIGQRIAVPWARPA